MQRTALVVDDHEDTLEITQGYLSLNDYRVFGASDGREALKIALKVCPDSILLDISLPEINGFDVAATLRQSVKFNDTLVVGYSGHAGREYHERARASGMDFYLVKPAEPQLLLACLQPEKYFNIIAESVALIDQSRELLQTSAQLFAECQAVSLRCQEAVRRAREIRQRVRDRREREGR